MKSQDVMVAALLAVRPHAEWSFASLAKATGLSASAVFRAVQRLRAAGLVVPERFDVFDDRLLAFLEHGVPYVFHTSPGRLARGIPTAYSAPPMNAHIASATPLVWPHPRGTVRGESIAPLAPTVPEAAQRDETLYNVLALIDALRIGRPREQQVAMTLLRKMIDHARLVAPAS